MKSALPEGSGVCFTACQFADERFVVDMTCQSMKLLGQESLSVDGGTRETESVGKAASAVHAIINTQNEK